ncbi:hypothetical protein SRHO_G00327520 [Serrasalmus rhombeus]
MLFPGQCFSDHSANKGNNVILIYRPEHTSEADMSEISLDVPSTSGPVNCDDQICTWYKDTEAFASTKYLVPDNVRLHTNGTVDLLLPHKGFQLMLQKFQRCNTTLTTELSSIISSLLDIDATFILEVNGEQCPTKYQVHAHAKGLTLALQPFFSSATMHRTVYLHSNFLVSFFRCTHSKLWSHDCFRSNKGIISRN